MSEKLRPKDRIDFQYFDRDIVVGFGEGIDLTPLEGDVVTLRVVSGSGEININQAGWRTIEPGFVCGQLSGATCFVRNGELDPLCIEKEFLHY